LRRQNEQAEPGNEQVDRGIEQVEACTRSMEAPNGSMEARTCSMDVGNELGERTIEQVEGSTRSLEVRACSLEPLERCQLNSVATGETGGRHRDDSPLDKLTRFESRPAEKLFRGRPCFMGSGQ